MTSVAVIGGDTPVGARVLTALKEHPRISRIVVLGARVLPQPPVEVYVVDVASADLKTFLDGIDVVIECASHVDPMPETDLLDRMTIETAANVMRAADAVSRYVQISSASVYGAWANNAVPLTESALVRPNSGFGPATRAAEIERRLFEWSADHPRASTVILRPAPVVAPGGSDLLGLLLAGRPPVVARDADPRIQVTHIDDLASAVIAAVFDLDAGVYNVASAGIVDGAAVADLLPGRRQVRVPGELLARGLHALWAAGAGDVPAEVLPYLRDPWTVDTGKLEAAGWAPRFTTAEAIRDALPHAVYTLPPAARRLAVTAVAVTVGVVAVATLAWSRRRSRR